MSAIVGLDDAIVRVSSKNYKETLSEMPTICVFGTAWCSQTLQLLLGVLPPFIAQYGRRVKFCYCELQTGQQKREGKYQNKILKDKFRIEYFPTSIAFIAGQEVDRKISECRALQQKQHLMELLEQVLKTT